MMDNEQAKQICALNLNIRSLPAHFDELEAFIDTLQCCPHVIGITETWLTSKHDPNMFNMKNFHPIYTKNRKHKGGGVAIYVSSSIVFSEHKVEGEFSFEHVEVILHLPKGNVLFAVIYNPKGQNVNFTDDFDSYLSSIRHQSAIIIGDFNIDTACSSLFANRYTNVIHSNGYHMLPSTHTRVTTRTKSCIDHTISNIAGGTVQVIHYPISDHFPTLSSFPMQIDKTHSRKGTYRSLKFL